MNSSLYYFFKRVSDIMLSGIAIICLSPLLIPLMIILRLTGEGYVFYTQKRVGFKKEEFDLLKFATMLKNSPNLAGGTITSKKDPRVLPLGGFLRKTKINELPQLFNIIRGDISIVGPRPQTEECFLMFPEKLQDQIYLSQPGLTGIGSVVFRDEEEMLDNTSKSAEECYREDIMPYKAELEIWYYNNKSLMVDAKLILLTAIAILLPNNELHNSWLNNLPRKSVSRGKTLDT